MKRRGYYIISPHGEARANILENDNLHIQVEFSAKLSQELYLKKANIILQKIDKRQCTAAKDVRTVGGKRVEPSSMPKYILFILLVVIVHETRNPFVRFPRIQTGPTATQPTAPRQHSARCRRSQQGQT
jgi:hypothetical protein